MKGCSLSSNVKRVESSDRTRSLAAVWLYGYASSVSGECSRVLRKRGSDPAVNRRI